MNKFKIIFLLIMCLVYSTRLIAQKNVKIIITEVSTNIGDCDADIFSSNNSDPIWWWSVNGSYEGCFETTCNGCTQSNINREIYNKSANCAQDYTSSISMGFSGCENDGAGCSDIWLVFTGICDGDVGSLTSGSRSDNISIPSTNGTYTIGPFTVTSRNGTFGGCVGNFTYTAVVQVSGSFLAENTNDNKCNATDLGYGSSISEANDYLEGQSNRCATQQSGEPQVTNILHDGSLFRDPVSVWYTFVTDNFSGVNACLDVSINSNNLDGHLTLFKSNGGCSDFGNLQLIAEGGLAGGGNDLTTLNDDIFVSTIQPNTRYYLQVIGNAHDLPGLYSAHLGEFNLSFSLNAIPNNDQFCDALNLAGSGIMTIGSAITLENESNSCASKQSGEPQVNNILHDGSAFRDLKSLWYFFETGNLGNTSACLDIVLNSNNLDGHLTLYKSNGDCFNFGNLTQIAEGGLLGGGNDLFTLNDDIFTTNIHPNSKYYIQVIGNAHDLPGLYTAHQGTFDLFVSLSAVPENDNFCQALNLGIGTLPLGTSVILENETNRCATKQNEEPQVNNLLHDASAFRDAKSMWYYFDTDAGLPVSNCLSVSMVSVNHTIDGHISVYVSDGNCNSFNNIIKIAEGGLAGGGNDLTTFDDYLTTHNLQSNKRYYIQIIGNVLDLPGFYSAHQGEFNLTVNLNTSPDNDNICNAHVLANGINFQSDQTIVLSNETNRCASKEANEPKVSDILHDASIFRDCQSVWYTLITDDLNNGEPSSIRVGVRSINGTIDAHVAIYKSINGGCGFGDLQEVAEGGLLGGGNDLVTKDDDVVGLNITPNTKYYIQVFGNAQDLPGLYSSHQGEFDLTVSVFTRPTNDNICAATSLGSIAISANVQMNNQSSYLATSQANEPNTFSTFYDVASVWYTFTVPNDGLMAANSLTATVYSIQDIDAHVAIYQGTCNYNQLQMIAEGGLPLTGLNDILTKNDEVSINCLVPDATYYIQVTGWEIALQENHHGVFNLQVTTTNESRPVHDNLINAIEIIPNSNSQIFSSACATLEDNEPSTIEDEIFDISPTNTVWHKFKTPSSTVNSVRATISTDFGGTTFDTEITLWYSRDESADPQDMVQVAYSEDIQLLINTNSVIEVDEIVPDAWYYVQVDGDDEGEHGNYEIKITASDGSPLPPGPIYHSYYFAQPGDEINTKKYDNFLWMNIIPQFKSAVLRNGQNITWDFNSFRNPTKPFNNRFFEPEGFFDGLVYTTLCELGCPTRCDNECNPNPPVLCYSSCIIACGFECLDDWEGFNLAYSNQDNIKIQNITLANPREIFKKTSDVLEAGAFGFNFVYGGLNLPVLAPYTARDKVYDFPIMWTKSHTSTSNWAVDLGAAVLGAVDLIIEDDRVRSAEVQGYGTLKVGGKVFPNAIKLRTEFHDNIKVKLLNQLDLVTDNLPDFLVPDNYVLYQWFVPGYEIPIATVVATEENGTELFWALNYWVDEYRDNPSARFIANVQNPVNNLGANDIGVKFLDASVNAEKYEWNFGDGFTSIERDPSHTYSRPGVYDVNLTVYDAQGLSDSYKEKINLFNLQSVNTLNNLINTELLSIDNESISRLEENGISVYPNPFNQSFSVDMTFEESTYIKISLIDVTGNEISLLKSGYGIGENLSEEFDLQSLNLPTGIYLLNIQRNDDQIDFIKLIKH